MNIIWYATKVLHNGIYFELVAFSLSSLIIQQHTIKQPIYYQHVNNFPPSSTKIINETNNEKEFILSSIWLLLFIGFKSFQLEHNLIHILGFCFLLFYFSVAISFLGLWIIYWSFNLTEKQAIKMFEKGACRWRESINWI